MASIEGLHSVESRSVSISWVSVGIGLVGTLVGVMGATIVRGRSGGEGGGVMGMEGIDAERGLQESLRRQLG